MKQTLPEQIYPWHQNVWETLTTRFPNIGHGLLFYGKKGCGKETFAEQFLAWVLCAKRQPKHLACGECGSCQWLKADTHPNYVHITTDEDNKKQNAKIKIEKIRD
ncbi:MAG: DNA polymerase III subunit delta', partial [Proteobacteria bacterium]|nr:DNA polymerase III subunit delta' [Pseudomonadota bacterium]